MKLLRQDLVLDNYPYLDIDYPYIDSDLAKSMNGLMNEYLHPVNQNSVFNTKKYEGQTSDNVFQATLESLFPSDQIQEKLLQARIELQLSSTEFSDVKLENLLADYDFLANYWLDCFERLIFDGKSLIELLRK